MAEFDKKGFAFTVRFTLLLCVLIASVNILPNYISNYSKESISTVFDTVKKVDDKILVAFVGDIMLDRGVENMVMKFGKGNFNYVFENIRDDLTKYDLIFGNLEGPVSDKGSDLQNLYSFRMDTSVPAILKDIGFDAVSVANNHINNWGKDAMFDTFVRLSEVGIAYSGGGTDEKEAYSPKVVNVKGTKISFLSYSEFGFGEYEAEGETGGVAMIYEEKLKNGIHEARGMSDIVVVSFHFGEEYQKAQNAYQEKYAKLAIDLGADIVIGHHPHVVQPLEKYKNAYIAYSLGNFVFDQYFSEETMKGALLEVEVADRQIKSTKMLDISIDKNFRPSFD